MENHVLKLCSDKDYVCTVLEEILIYDEQDKSLVLAVALVERAENDLKQLISIWNNPQK